MMETTSLELRLWLLFDC